jgi:hypothetical protein
MTMSDHADEILAFLRKLDAKFARLHVEMRQFLDRSLRFSPASNA